MQLWHVLKHSHELHIRWASERPSCALPPFISRISPGLHVFFTPLQRQNGQVDPFHTHRALQADIDISALLCPILRKIFGPTLKCASPANTFTIPPLISSRFASTSSLQYYSTLSSLVDLVTYIQQKICNRSDTACSHSASLLDNADSLDIDYDSISHALTVTTVWFQPPSNLFNQTPSQTPANAWSVTIDAVADNVEVGVLRNEAPSEPSELQLSGFLAVVGEDERPSPTLFSFPSRHHVLPDTQSVTQSYSISFDMPTGLHPTLRIAFSSAASLVAPSNKPEDSSCALHTYLTLTSALFADKYQLATTDRLFLQAHNLHALRSISGETDLEAPDYVVQKWGSNVLLELATPDHSSAGDAPWDVTVPLHLRYLEPAAGGEREIQIPWPIVFWACTAEEGTRFPVNPFDRINLGYDGIFGPRTMFYHLKTSTENRTLVETVTVPVLDIKASGARWIGIATVAAISLGFLWTLLKLHAVAALGMNRAKVETTRAREEKKQP